MCHNADVQVEVASLQLLQVVGPLEEALKTRLYRSSERKSGNEATSLKQLKLVWTIITSIRS